MTRDVVTVWAHDRLDRPWEVMQVRRIRHLPVLDDKNRLIGLVTHRDLLAASQSSLSFTNEAERVLGWAHVADVMETHLSTASPEEPAAEAGRRMVRHKIGCLLVVDEGGRLVGIVTEEDFLRWATEHMGAPDTAGDPGRGRNFADVTGGRSEPGATSATIRRSG
jgi:CBS domain-containing protein